jgi:hypothetical protein
MNVHRVSNVRQIEIHTAEPLDHQEEQDVGWIILNWILDR